MHSLNKFYLIYVKIKKQFKREAGRRAYGMHAVAQHNKFKKIKTEIKSESTQCKYEPPHHLAIKTYHQIIVSVIISNSAQLCFGLNKSLIHHFSLCNILALNSALLPSASQDFSVSILTLVHLWKATYSQTILTLHFNKQVYH